MPAVAKIPVSEFKGVWVVAEWNTQGQLTESTLEGLAAARSIASQSQETVTAVVLAADETMIEGVKSTLASYGADAVLGLTNPLLKTYQNQLYTNAMAQAIEAKKPSVVLMGASSTSRDFLPRLATKVFAGFMADAVALTVLPSGQIEVTRSAYAENMLAKVSSATIRPQLITTRAKVFRKLEADAGRAATSETMPVSLEASMAGSELVEIVQGAAASGKSLEDAEVVVSGGRGVKGPENFNLVEDLAASLGAAVGASRAVVDAGWRPHSEQVGQTGKTVSPNVYIALGIHGAIQHQVGMSSSRHIIAVNTNPDAPIFEIADLGVVGDLFQIAPALTKAIKEQNLTAV